MQVRISKNETINFLRKQLQVLMIQIWSILQEVEEKYYLIEEFKIVSLYPPVNQSHLNETMGNSTLMQQSIRQPGPPAGNYRFAMNTDGLTGHNSGNMKLIRSPTQ